MCTPSSIRTEMSQMSLEAFYTTRATASYTNAAINGRIESESEPPNLATEIDAGCGFILAPNPPSPVRIGKKAKQPKPRGIAGIPR
jgi:hypothetical protein